MFSRFLMFGENWRSGDDITPLHGFFDLSCWSLGEDIYGFGTDLGFLKVLRAMTRLMKGLSEIAQLKLSGALWVIYGCKRVDACCSSLVLNAVYPDLAMHNAYIITPLSIHSL